jgi:hypothetical protein
MAEADRHHREALLDTWQRAVEELHQAARDRDAAYLRASETGAELAASYGLKLSATFDPATAAALNVLKTGGEPGAVDVDWAICPPPVLKAVG